MSDIYKQIANLPPEKREVLEMMLMEQGVDLAQMAIIPVSRDINKFPLSYSQQRLWFLDQLEPGSPLYNICSPILIKGNLNKDALKSALCEIIKRHEVLRTTFTNEGKEPYQIVQQAFEPDIDIVSESNNNDIQQLIFEESIKPFDLNNGPLLRVKQIQISDDKNIIILTLHHIVSDNWSTGILIHEIMQLYPALANEDKISLAELPVQYADFSSWQRKWLSGKTLQNQLDYWEKQLAGIPPILEMPSDFPRPAVQTFNGDNLLFDLDIESVQNIKQLCEKFDITPFMALLSVFQIMLFKYSGQNDFCIGSPIANRNRSETESLIGFFINTLVLRADLSGNPKISELLKRVKETTIGAIDHQDLPFETLVEKLDPKRDMSHTPLFQVMFVLNNAPVETLKLPELEVSLVELDNKTSKFDLIFNFTENGDLLNGKVEFNTDVFKAETISQMIGHFKQTLTQLLKNTSQTVSEISLLEEDERNLVLNQWASSERTSNATKLIPEMIDENLTENADKIALQIADQNITYKDLLKKSNSLATFLVNEKKIQPGDIVAVLANRSAEMIYGMLGVMKAGATYLPLDASYPQDRLQYMIDDSNAKLLLTKSDLDIASKLEISEKIIFKNIPENNEVVNQAKPNSPAYIIYTSGSTGNPKGVLVAHQTIADHCLDMARHYNLTSKKNVLQFAALNFDASLEQILPTLISGATLVLRDDEVWPAADFMAYVNKYNLNVINLPTAYWNQLTEYLSSKEQIQNLISHNLELVIIGGDTMKLSTLKKWYSTILGSTRLLNAYGPTEAVITASTFEISKDLIKEKLYSSIPIGKACANRKFYILDENGSPVPPGFPGELHITGDALAIGYHNLEETTKEKFVQNPFSDKQEKMYKTGDKVCFSSDGNLEFLGRVDEQVKIRGFRIEPGEVEAALLKHVEIQETVVIPNIDASGEKTLFAYFIPKPGTTPTISNLRSFLAKQLPAFMVPAIFIPLSEFPLQPSGKINKNNLPIPDDIRVQLATEYVAPRTDTEKVLAEIVAEVLKIDKVGINDNFFELGGHSMLGTLVISMIREKFNVEVPLRALFESPTVNGISLAIAEVQAEEHDDDELSDMLDELEGMSDDEIAALLEDDE
ncbi:MAG: amino acid adenylation domain-containing protein [Calditrichaeota bacterium]|nr:MAG: amino acid adenylation domain-containing protein [Calditrichota bacterium]MBL1204439.1 amino acid adenylation domain-containing protein [Calditrichota bacterium]NOG44268.1 amino acid adenylation domain-containing protein [Calditrichota bacterium]